MAAGASLDSLPTPPVHAGAPARRSLWARLRTSRFLFISISVHVLFGLGAAIYVVQTYTPKRKLTFKGGPPEDRRAWDAIVKEFFALDLVPPCP